MKIGYHIDPNRKCRFSMDYVTPGYQGLAWAVLLKALEDGCSQDWIEDIVEFYDINISKDMLKRLPANKIKFNNGTNQMMGVHFEAKGKLKPLLSMEDGLHLKGLENVASGD
jgi:hypothetical protein